MSPKGYPGTKAPHGTLSRYFGNGCRCERCQNARRQYDGSRPRAEYDAERKAQADARHGYERSYLRGCRCEACREASRVARARRRAKAAT